MKITTRTLMYIVNVGYYDFAFCDPNKAMDFAREAMRSNIEEGGIRVSIELKWEEAEEEPAEVGTEDVIDIDSLNLDGGYTE